MSYSRKKKKKFISRLVKGPPMRYRWAAWKTAAGVDLDAGVEQQYT